MAPMRSCRPAQISYTEPSSDQEDRMEQSSYDVNHIDNKQITNELNVESDSEPMSTPTKARGSANTSIQSTTLSKLAQSNDETNLDDIPIEDMIGNFIDFHYAPTGRFDQHFIDADHPLPTGPGPLERLGIAATMVIFFRENIHKIKEIDPRNLEKLKPFSDGVPWCQYENACLVEEMCLWARTRGESKIGGQTLMGKMATILNQKYGIGRSGTATKNQWYRFLRDRTGIDERGNFGASATSNRHGGPLAVSIGGSRKSKVVSGRVTKRKATSQKS